MKLAKLIKLRTRMLFIITYLLGYLKKVVLQNLVLMLPCVTSSLKTSWYWSKEIRFSISLTDYSRLNKLSNSLRNWNKRYKEKVLKKVPFLFFIPKHIVKIKIKLEKGKNVEEIADDLEESIEKIKELMNAL